MSTLLKDRYNPLFYNHFSDILIQVIPGFNKEKFNRLIFNHLFDSYELKQRVIHTTDVLHQFLSPDFGTAAFEIKKIIKLIQKSENLNDKSFEFLFLPEYISRYGTGHFESSVSAMEAITQFTSCEFAVRPFFLKYDKKMPEQMLEWSRHAHFGVRRLSSEGFRPRLPWGMRIPELIKNPAPILPVLENLKLDPSETVRRSVANNLNDISKDHPELVRSIAKKWLGQNAQTNALVKHGCRTLLKRGDIMILNLFGFDSRQIELSRFSIKTPNVKMGNHLEFSFSVANLDSKKRSVRLEYAIYYPKKNGELSKKVFKISERDFAPGSHQEVTRRQSFRKITTRTFYAGEHKLAIIVNGRESETKSFELIP